MAYVGVVVVKEKTVLVGLLGSVIATGGSVVVVYLGGENIGPLLLIYILVALAVILLVMDYVEGDERDSEQSNAEEVACDALQTIC